MRDLSRRNFLGNVGAGAAGILAGGAALGASYPANDAIGVGFIGTGGRCLRALLPNVKRIEGTRLVAVCDVWERRLEEAKTLAGAPLLSTRVAEELLGVKDVSAVVIATPDHLHVPMTVAACNAGKDVYVEKPLTHDLSEGAAVIRAQNDNGRVVQVGMQQRSMPQIKRAYEVVRSGRLGKVHKVHLSWNRNSRLGGGVERISPESVDWKRFVGGAPSQEFDAYRMRNWRWFWDFGGGILTDLMVHFIDVMNWCLDVDHPATAWTMGDHFQTKGRWETPDTIQTLLHYPERELQVHFEGTFSNARNAAMIEIMGTDATLYADRGRFELHPERDGVEYEEFVPGKSKRGADFDQAIDGAHLHLLNWLECVRSRAEPIAPAEAGVAAASGAHLGNISYRKGIVARWDEVAASPTGPSD